jgi:hypothetical protein
LSPQHDASLGYKWRDGLQHWRVAVNMFNKLSWTDEKGVVLQLGFGCGANNPSP